MLDLRKKQTDHSNETTMKRPVMTLDQAFDFLAEMGEEGSTMLDFMEALKLAEGQARSTGKKAKISLEITIEEIGDENVTIFAYSPKVTKSLPAATQRAKMLYMTDEGFRTRDNPKQYKMAFIETEPRSTRVVDPDNLEDSLAGDDE